MSLYVGSIENWNKFFTQLGYKPKQQAPDLSLLIESLQQQKHNVTDLVDYFQSDFFNVNHTEEWEKIGLFTNKSKVFLYSTDRYDYESMIECLTSNLDNQDEPEDLLRYFFIEPYKKFHKYNGLFDENGNYRKDQIFQNLAYVWSPSYLPLMPEAFIISDRSEKATHSIYFIPYGNVTEIWLYESSADFYRFKCFAEMMVIDALTTHLGYEGLLDVTLEDLKKYNADLILDLDLLQQADLPME